MHDRETIGMFDKIYRSGRESAMLFYLKKLSSAELTIIYKTCFAVMECIDSDDNDLQCQFYTVLSSNAGVFYPASFYFMVSFVGFI